MSDKKTIKSTKSVPPPSKAKAASKSAKAKAAPVVAAPAAPAPQPTAEFKSHSFRRKMIGIITSDKMNKTVVVEVIRKAMDPVYKKYVRMRDRYKAHDELNQYKTGDRVEITEHRPISRDKRWLVTRLLTRRVEA